MKYQVVIDKPAMKFLLKQPQEQRERLLKAIYKLPDMGDIKPMSGHENLYRLRVGTCYLHHRKQHFNRPSTDYRQSWRCLQVNIAKAGAAMIITAPACFFRAPNQVYQLKYPMPRVLVFRQAIFWFREEVSFQGMHEQNC